MLGFGNLRVHAVGTWSLAWQSPLTDCHSPLLFLQFCFIGKMKQETLHEGVESEIPVDDYDYDSSTNLLDAAFSHHPHHHPAKRGGKEVFFCCFFFCFFSHCQNALNPRKLASVAIRLWYTLVLSPWPTFVPLLPFDWLIDPFYIVLFSASGRLVCSSHMWLNKWL